jgi:hypothetical protein
VKYSGLSVAGWTGFGLPVDNQEAQDTDSGFADFADFSDSAEDSEEMGSNRRCL